MEESYLIYSETAKRLFKQVKDLPIIDYHCHLSINEILENKPFENITQMWLYADHYKWRLMRMGGVEEKYVTGDATDFEKFEKYVQTLSYAIGSPLYHWSKLELDTYFGVNDEILPQNIEKIYKKANETIAINKLTPQKILQMSNVERVCIVEDALTFDGNAYEQVAKLKLNTKITPILRVDKLILLREEEVRKATPGIIEKFLKAGCDSADFGVEFINDDDEKMITKYSYLLNECYKNKFVVQLHFGPMRNNNKPMLERLGVDKGYDSISEKPYLSALVKIFASIQEVGKTVIFNLNPADNAKIASFASNFAGGNIKGKVQMGAAWWFNDNKDGITEFFKIVSSMALLSASVGMLTDSRSIISYARHNYFRRLLCNYVGDISEKGEFTKDFNILKKIVCDISYFNVKEFLS